MCNLNSVHTIDQCIRMHKITVLHTCQRNSIQGGDVCHDCLLFDSVAVFLGNISVPKQFLMVGTL